MDSAKQAQPLARLLFKLSFEGGQLSAERVSGVLAYLDENPPRHALAVLKAYQHLIQTEVAKGRAVVEHAGQLPEAALSAIAATLSKKYFRQVEAIAQPNPALLAGMRVRIGDDIFESSIAAQLEALAAAV